MIKIETFLNLSSSYTVMTMTLEGKVAIVTGGSRGIGAKIVESLYAAGSDVIINYSNGHVVAQQLKETLERTHDANRLVLGQADVTNYGSMQYLMEHVAEAFGRIDILVNNAGIPSAVSVEKMAPEEWLHVIDVNLNGVFNASKAAIPYLKQSGEGRIINISSMTGEAPAYGLGAYAASKAGVVGLTKTLAIELAKSGVTVNAIAPGYIDDGMFLTVPETVREQLVKQIPARRFGSGEDVANMVKFLASKEAGYITGQTINVNGGALM